MPISTRHAEIVSGRRHERGCAFGQRPLERHGSLAKLGVERGGRLNVELKLGTPSRSRGEGLADNTFALLAIPAQPGNLSHLAAHQPTVVPRIEKDEEPHRGDRLERYP